MNRRVRLTLYFTLVVNTVGFTAISAELSQGASRHPNDLARDKTSLPDQVIAFAEVKKDMTVLDLFAGGGYYSELLAQQVGLNGQVVMHNNQAYLPYAKDEINRRQGRLTELGVSQHIAEADKLALPEEHFDRIFMVLSFHDFYHKSEGWDVKIEDVLPQLYNSLKPDGKLLIIDHSALAGSQSEAAQSLHRIDEAFTQIKLEEYGFVLIKQADFLRNSNDPRNIVMSDPSIRRQTDRFVQLYQKQ